MATCERICLARCKANACFIPTISDLQNITLLMENCVWPKVAERTSADKKGGHLARRKADGRFIPTNCNSTLNPKPIEGRV